MRDKVSQPYNTIGNIIGLVLYVLTFNFLKSTRKDKAYGLYREISIALDSKHGLCAFRWRCLTRGDTDLEMCADSTVGEYIPRIHAGSQFVVA